MLKASSLAFAVLVPAFLVVIRFLIVIPAGNLRGFGGADAISSANWL